ncbi:ABC transporter ATP-binding protein [Azospirillum sp. TSO35-2]|uniref:ABC transporter ATP-binding protein n=1 Tax=Azospirillum sp. TSO35-2 TaxID=716796 RepID=UPI000D611D8E|nr:ABC transporter ATP-binding protein [Azospirillum sp. TSO35-2]PWC37731.1 ABC transporter ATP-binding protein [Azospirillum sp. TSO35-2]
MAEPLLSVRGLSAGYGDASVLDEVSFELEEGGALALLGRNGMGKSTLLATLMGHTLRRGGTIALRGRPVERLAPYRRPDAGFGWVPQERDIFPSLTVEENLTVAARRGPWTLARVHELFPRLRERRTNLGSQLSGGEQQMLAIGRALMLNPALVLLDEPLEGLAPVIVEELSAAIRRMVEREGLAIILVEQHAHIALGLTRDAIVLERGRIVHRAPSTALAQDHATLERYVGMRVAAKAA